MGSELIVGLRLQNLVHNWVTVFVQDNSKLEKFY